MHIGLTGGIAAGKSEVSLWFASQGALILDADRIAHELQENCGELLQALRQAFPADCFDTQGRVIRQALARHVFADPAELERLNQISFPYLHQELNARRRQAEAGSLLLVDAALLFEWGIEREFDEVWVVSAPDELRLKRVMRRMHLSHGEALERLHRQMPQEDKLARADLVIDNGGSLQDLHQQLADLIRRRGILMQESAKNLEAR